jgi:hypothetical protein
MCIIFRIQLLPHTELSVFQPDKHFQLMLYTQTIIVYCVLQNPYTYSVDKMLTFLKLKLVVHIVTTTFYRRRH